MAGEAEEVAELEDHEMLAQQVPWSRGSYASDAIVKAESPQRHSRLRRDWPVWLVSGATLASGVLGIVQVLVVRFSEAPQLFNLILPFGVHHWSRSLTLAFGFVLIYLSFHLFYRRHVAWWLATGSLSLAVLAHLGHGRFWFTSLAPAVTLVLLVLSRRRFTVRSEPSSLAQGLELTVFSILIALAYGTLGFWLQDRRDFGITFSLGDSWVRTLREFTLIGNTDLTARTRHARWFLESLRVFGLMAGTFVAYSLFRPVAYRLRTLPHERTVAKDILAQHGRSSSDFFKLWPDKSYFFSSSRRCFIAYKTALSVAISLGDPVGPDGELEDTTRAFLHFCADNGWTVAFHQVLPDLLAIYRSLDLQVLKIGEEAVVDINHFLTETLPKKKELRRVQRRFEGQGYVLSRALPPHAPALLDEAKEVSDEWLSLPGRRERRFTLGRFERGYVSQTSLFTLRDPSSRLIAFANEIPSYRPGEATIDLMRHRREIPNGAMDYLFMGLMEGLKREGYLRFSLGLAPFAGVGDRPGAALQERAVHQLFEHLNRFFSYKGLHVYKAKFEPLWEERFMVYQGGPLGLARITVALIRVTEG